MIKDGRAICDECRESLRFLCLMNGAKLFICDQCNNGYSEKGVRVRSLEA